MRVCCRSRREEATTKKTKDDARYATVAFAATSQRRNFFSFLVCFPFSSFLFASQCVSVLVCLPMSESQRQLSQSKPAPGNKCKSKVYNVCSDGETLEANSGTIFPILRSRRIPQLLGDCAGYKQIKIREYKYE